MPTPPHQDQGRAAKPGASLARPGASPVEPATPAKPAGPKSGQKKH